MCTLFAAIDATLALLTFSMLCLFVDFDQFIINFANIKHDRNSLRELMSYNSAKQLPTAIVADQHDRQLLGDYLDEQHLHSSVVVNSSLSAKERARYKTELSLILARKIYRQYKKLIH